MRLYIHTTPNTETVPFNYQPALVGALHKWLGQNEQHDKLSLYSLSWLEPGKRKNGGLHFPQGSSFFFSSPDTATIQRLVGSIQQDSQIAWGMEVSEIVMKLTPDFGKKVNFWVQSPVLIQRNIQEENGWRKQFYYVYDESADQLLTETLQHKLAQAGKSQLHVKVGFDRSYRDIQIKGATYKGIHNKGTVCPVIIEGDPEAVRFAWEVGVGNSTGIGFGALK